MRRTGAVVRPSRSSLCSIIFETAISWSICGVSRRSSSRSSSDRTRLEWTVDTMYGRRCPISPRAIAARVPTISARYMWLWMTSGRTSTRCAASAPTAMASSGSSMTARRTRPAAACGRRCRATAPRSRRRTAPVHPGHEGVQVLLGAAVRAGREDLDDPDAVGQRRGPHDRLEAGIEAAVVTIAHQTDRRTSRRWIGSSTAPHSYLYGSSPRRKSSRRSPWSRARRT